MVVISYLINFKIATYYLKRVTTGSIFNMLDMELIHPALRKSDNSSFNDVTKESFLYK